MILTNILACLLALGCSCLLWKKDSGVLRNGAVIAGGLLLFCLYGFFVVGSFTTGAAAADSGQLELYPFSLMALCLCFSTLRLQKSRGLYLVLAQVLWCWIELFGAVSLHYRGLDVAWLRVIAVAVVTAGSLLLPKNMRPVKIGLTVFWAAIWIVFT